jgi:hypothetical protein
MENDYFYNQEKVLTRARAKARFTNGYITREEYDQICLMWRRSTKATDEERERIVTEIRALDEAHGVRVERTLEDRTQRFHTALEEEKRLAAEWFSKQNRNKHAGAKAKPVSELERSNYRYRIRLWRQAVKKAEEWLNSVD